MDKKAVPIRNSVLSYTVPKPHRDLESPMSFRVDKQTKTLITVMLHDARDKIGWVSPGDFLRWAVHESLGKVTADLKNNKLSSMFGYVEAALEVAREELYQQTQQKLLKETHARVTAMREDGAVERIPSFVKSVWAKLSPMPPGYWNDRIKKQFLVDFGSLLDAGRISNHPQDAVKEEE